MFMKSKKKHTRVVLVNKTHLFSVFCGRAFTLDSLLFVSRDICRGKAHVAHNSNCMVVVVVAFISLPHFISFICCTERSGGKT